MFYRQYYELFFILFYRRIIQRCICCQWCTDLEPTCNRPYCSIKYLFSFVSMFTRAASYVRKWINTVLCIEIKKKKEQKQNRMIHLFFFYHWLILFHCLYNIDYCTNMSTD